MEKVTPKKSLTEETYDILVDAICTGELEPGERLMQDDLAARLNVSRQPVNSAISILRTNGLVEDNGRRGVLVRELDPELFQSIYEFRGVVEPFALSLACQRLQGGDLRSAKAEAGRVLALGEAAVESRNIRELVAADIQFHEMIYAWSGNVVIASSMRSNWHHIRRAMAKVLRMPDLPDSSWRDHAEIAEALFADDCPAAETIMARHLETARKMLAVVFEKTDAPGD